MLFRSSYPSPLSAKIYKSPVFTCSENIIQDFPQNSNANHCNRIGQKSSRGMTARVHKKWRFFPNAPLFLCRHLKFLDPDCAHCPDIHRVDIAAAHIFCDVVHISVSLCKRYQTHDHTCKPAAVHTAYTVTDLFQEQLCECERQRDLLLLAVLQRITVLQKLPLGSA